ncbi:hypothetical protein [Marinomonas sp. TW1]|uniref:hypothetical protein n=1 Tax=Marinomonas sp. TW1 TaxID=1561203 RepID=UPI0007AEE898|nr:hypothetical protein [Marinomonas sp. TW1]KZN13051.1 hypothetical protein OA79_12930 [Marinomonas sp. TW1]
MKKRLPLFCLLLSVIWFSGCSIQLVSSYDAKTLEQMERIDQDIDRFYLTLQTQPESNRTYALFSDQYLNIEVNIRSLERRQAMREKNEETLAQTKTLKAFWQQDMTSHKRQNSVSDFIIKRRMDQYQRLMKALIQGEMAKQ